MATEAVRIAFEPLGLRSVCPASSSAHPVSRPVAGAVAGRLPERVLAKTPCPTADGRLSGDKNRPWTRVRIFECAQTLRAYEPPSDLIVLVLPWWIRTRGPQLQPYAEQVLRLTTAHETSEPLTLRKKHLEVTGSSFSHYRHARLLRCAWSGSLRFQVARCRRGRFIVVGPRMRTVRSRAAASCSSQASNDNINVAFPGTLFPHA
jgi:hypothetical protein